MKKVLGLMFASLMTFALAMPAVASTTTIATPAKTAKTNTSKVKKNHKAPKPANKPAAKTN